MRVFSVYPTSQKETLNPSTNKQTYQLSKVLALWFRRRRFFNKFFLRKTDKPKGGAILSPRIIIWTLVKVIRWCYMPNMKCLSLTVSEKKIFKQIVDSRQMDGQTGTTKFTLALCARLDKKKTQALSKCKFYLCQTLGICGSEYIHVISSYNLLKFHFRFDRWCTLVSSSAECRYSTAQMKRHIECCRSGK